MADERAERGGPSLNEGARPNETDSLGAEAAPENSTLGPQANRRNQRTPTPSEPQVHAGTDGPSAGEAAVEVNRYVDNCDMGWC